MSPEELVLADLVDALIQERLFGFGDGVLKDGWYHVGQVRVRVRHGGALQPHRFARGPVFVADRPVSPDELICHLAPDQPHVNDVANDLRAAVAHAALARSASCDPGDPSDLRLPDPLDPLAGERLAHARNRPFHPTARAATGWSAEELSEYGPTRREPLGLDWVAVRADHLRYGGGNDGGDTTPDELARRLLGAAEAHRLTAECEPGFRLLPVHPWQFEHVLPREFAAELEAGLIRPVARGLGEFRPTASLRTLVSPDSVNHVKLPLGIATLGATRLLPPRYLDNGERAEHTLRAALTRDPLLRSVVAVCDERTWLGWNGDDEFADRPGQLAAQLRRYPPEGANAVPMAAFAAPELYPRGIALDHGPLPFFRRLCHRFCLLALGFLRQGMLPEVHGQNVAVTLVQGMPELFVLRDHDTVRVHPPWLAMAGIPDPAYRVRQGARQSLRLDEPAELVGYFQTLGVQVNLYGIADALARSFGIAERTLWRQLRAALTDAMDLVEVPPQVSNQLLREPTWPSRHVLGPLLRDGSSQGVSMPAGTGAVPNPLLY